MLHPNTELKFVSPEIGYGIFATCNIPIGTIMWVKDQLDRVFSKEEVEKLNAADFDNLMKYTYRDKNGDYFFCWDLNRYTNHSFEPNSMITPFGFEIAIREIKAGEEITNDYGTLNIIEPFKCANGPFKDRDYVRPDDLVRFYPYWDEQLRSAFKFINDNNQPLANFLSTEQTTEIKNIASGRKDLPSILNNYFQQ